MFLPPFCLINRIFDQQVTQRFSYLLYTEDPELGQESSGVILLETNYLTDHSLSIPVLLDLKVREYAQLISYNVSR
jgi:hypothetical protein